MLGGRFKIIRKIGEGGSAEVFLVEDIHNNKRYALKLLKTKKSPEKALKPYSFTQKLNHPGIVKIFETGVLEQKPYVLMEYVDGEPLNEVLDKLNLKEKIRIAKQILEALAYAHKNGILHKDLKPENILITKNLKVKLTDFGLARENEVTPTMTGEIAGTPSYISPEELQGERATTASDVFSLGCVLYELFTGEHPFKRKNISQSLFAILKDNPQDPLKINPEIPERISKIITKCLLKTPEFRYKDAEEVLSDFISDRKITITRPAEKRKAIVMLSIVIMLFITTFWGSKLLRKREPKWVKIHANSMSVYDNEGNILFTKNTGSDISVYRISDIDGDGHKEIVVGTGYLKTLNDKRKIPGNDTATIYCFSNRGKVKWKYYISDKNIYNKPQTFEIDKIVIPEETTGCFVIGVKDAKWFPYLIKFICINTKNTKSFWHSGWVFHLATMDINKDGYEDVIGGGVNNDLGMKPVVFALNGKQFHAQSPPWWGEDISEEHGLLFYTLLPGSEPVEEIQEYEKEKLFKIITRTGKIYYITREGILTEKDKIPENQTAILNLSKELMASIKAATRLSKDGKPAEGARVIQKWINYSKYKYRKNLYPLYAFLYLYRGTLLSDAAKYDAAKASFEEALKFDPLYAAPFENIAFLYFKTWDFAKASLYFKKAYAIGGDQWAYFYAMLTTAFSGNFKDALRMQRDYAKKNDLFFKYFSSMLFYVSGLPDSALSYANRILKEAPGMIITENYIPMAIATDLNKISEIDTTQLKEFPDTYGAYLFRKGEYKSAKSVLMAALKNDFKNATDILSIIQLWRTYYYLYLLHRHIDFNLSGKESVIKKIKIKPVIR